MTRVIFLVGVLLGVSCGGGSEGLPCGGNRTVCTDAGDDPMPTPCNPLTQERCAAGEKCTWIVDAVLPTYVGHVGCALDGSRAAGEPCSFGMPGVTGYDDCERGLVCNAYRGGPGVCRDICDQQGGAPMCPSGRVCMTQPALFQASDSSPPTAGICEVACDPLTDNDFDGAGTASSKSTTACGSDATMGCYGMPSLGTQPRTMWSCMAERHPTASLRHRVQCSTATGCADPGPVIHANSCNQGYVAVLREGPMLTTMVCAALCKPKNCYAGNCGTNNDNRLGEAPHRCMTPDRAGTFDTSPGGEHCTFMWHFELDDQDQFLRSPSSDTLGFCYDHAKYGLPPCATLSLQEAARLGCVDSVTAGR